MDKIRSGQPDGVTGAGDSVVYSVETEDSLFVSDSRRGRGGLLSKLRNIKAVCLANKEVSFLIIFAAIYMVISFVSPTTRDFFYWQARTGKEFVSIAFQLMFGITTFPLILELLNESFPIIKKTIDKLITANMVIYTIVFIMIMCLYFTAMRIPGWWWTWLTIGLQLIVIAATALALKHKVSPSTWLFAGIALMGINIGLWEIPYQIGLKLVWENYLPLRGLLMGMATEIIKELAFIVGGVILLAVLQEKYKILQFNKWFWIFLSATVILYILWFTTGFWVEMTYDWNTYEWIQHPVNYWAKLDYRLSKVTLTLAMISLVWHNMEFKGGRVCLK